MKILKLFFGFLVLAIEIRGLASKSSKSIIYTPSGTIEGRSSVIYGRTVDQYFGVPYPEPPIGEHRFQKPVPIKSWSGIKRCLKKWACSQFSEINYPWYDPEPGTTEDCLTLNIYVPRQSNEAKAIMFFIHGGAFNFGSNRMPLYDGTILAQHGNVIVVVPNFRLGVFGFFTSGTADAPGNVGLYDLVEALRWLKTNIAFFGGDPKKITIAGESSGAISVSMLAVSPLASGLYNRAIAQSGSAHWLLTDFEDYNIDLGQTLGKRTMCANDTHTIRTHPTEVVNCLRDISAIDLANATVDINPGNLPTFIPQFGDSLLPRNPRTEIIKGNFKATELLISTNNDEGGFVLTSAQRDLCGPFGEKDPKINKTLGEDILKQYFSQYGLDDDLITIHYLGKLDEYDYEAVRKQVYTAMGDFLLLCPSVYFAERNSELNPNVFYYNFNHRPYMTPWSSWMGVPHFEEVQFVFGQPLRAASDCNSNEKLLSQEMMNLWTNFTKHGIPSNTQPRYSKDTKEMTVLHLGKNYVTRGPHIENCNFFRPYFFK